MHSVVPPAMIAGFASHYVRARAKGRSGQFVRGRRSANWDHAGRGSETTFAVHASTRTARSYAGTEPPSPKAAQKTESHIHT
jgi:hypothetical protein